MLASLKTHAQKQQQNWQQAAATSMAAQPAEVVGARLSYQALLEAPPALSAQQGQLRSSSCTVQVCTERVLQAAQWPLGCIRCYIACLAAQRRMCRLPSTGSCH